MFYSGLLSEGGRKDSDMREAASLRQQRRMKQAVQFIHKDSADLLPLDGLKKLGSSKDTVSPRGRAPLGRPARGGRSPSRRAVSPGPASAAFTESPAGPPRPPPPPLPAGSPFLSGFPSASISLLHFPSDSVVAPPALAALRSASPLRASPFLCRRPCPAFRPSGRFPSRYSSS